MRLPQPLPHNMPLVAIGAGGLLIVFTVAFVAGCLIVTGIRRRAPWSPLLLAIVPHLLMDPV